MIQYRTNRDDASSEEIQEEIERSRHRLSETIEELSEELTMSALMERAIDEVSTEAIADYGHKAEDLAKEFALGVRRNPVPSILIGIGIFLWLSEPKKRQKKTITPHATELSPELSQPPSI